MLRQPKLFALLLLLTTAPWHIEAAINCFPVPAAADDATAAVSAPVWIDVLANDSDPSGQALAVSVLEHDCRGRTSVEFGLVRFTPSASFLHDCQIPYQVTNEDNESAEAVIAVQSLVTIFSDGFENGTADSWRIEV